MAKKDAAAEQTTIGSTAAGAAASASAPTSSAAPNGANGNGGGNGDGSKAALALVTRDELANVLGDGEELATDGLEELGAEDIKIPLKVFNFKGTDRAGDPIPPNVYFDTVEETTKRELDLALLTLTKSNEWREFDDKEQANKVRCRSFDRVTGTMDDGTERRCEGCPDAQWTTNQETGKRERRCGPVYNVVAVERDVGTPCIIRFRRTSLPVIQQYLNRHFIGRRVVAGKPSNYPLFAFGTKATLKMEKSGGTTWAVPVLERGPVNSAEEIRQHAESAKAYRETVLPLLHKIVEKADKSEEGGAADASFSPDEFADPKKAAGTAGGGANGGGAGVVDADGLR